MLMGINLHELQPYMDMTVITSEALVQTVLQVKNTAMNLGQTFLWHCLWSKLNRKLSRKLVKI